jgi:hypothetical protein
VSHCLRVLPARIWWLGGLRVVPVVGRVCVAGAAAEGVFFPCCCRLAVGVWRGDGWCAGSGVFRVLVSGVVACVRRRVCRAFGVRVVSGSGYGAGVLCCVVCGVAYS